MSGSGNSSQQGFPQIQSPVVDTKTGFVTAPWYQLFLSLWNRTGAGQGGSTVPTGMAIFSPSGQIPGGWYELAGQTITQSVDPGLYAIYGTRLPDMRGRFALGANGSHDVGTTGGAEAVNLSVGQLPSHTHSVTDPGHVHTALVASSTNTAGAAAGTGTAGNTGSAVTGITIGSTGSGDAVPTIPPYYTGIWIVKR